MRFLINFTAIIWAVYNFDYPHNGDTSVEALLTALIMLPLKAIAQISAMVGNL